MKKKWILIILCFFIMFSLKLFAEDSGNKNVAGKIGVGMSGYGSNDYLGKAAEYKTDDSNVNLKLNLKGNKNGSDFDFNGNFISTDDSNFSGSINVMRYFKIDGSYQKFIHRLDHDEMYSHYINKPTNLKDYPFILQKDINGDGKPEKLQGFPVGAIKPLKAPTKPGSPMTWYDLIKNQYNAKNLNKGWVFDDANKTITIDGKKTDYAVLTNLYPYYNDLAAFEEHGPKGWQYTDHNVGKDYYIHRELTKTNIKLALPFLPSVSIIGKYRNEKRTGFKQVMGMSAHCATCHIESFSKRIDQEDTSYTAGIAYDSANINFVYTHTWEHFSRDDAHTKYFYGLTHRPPVNDPYYDGYGFPKNQDFANRVRFQGEEVEFARTPKTTKDIDEAKLRITLAKQTNFYTSFTSIRASDTDRTDVLTKDLDSNYTGFMSRISSNFFKKLNVTVGYKHYTVDTDDIYVPDVKAISPAGWGAEAYKDNNVDFGYKRKSEADRNVDEIELGLSYFVNSYLSLKGKVSYKQIDRDNPMQVFENPTFDAQSGNAGKVQLDEYDYGDTDITEVNLSMYFYPFRKLHGMLSFKYKNIDDPFRNPNAKGEKNKLLNSVLTPIVLGPKVDVTKGVPDILNGNLAFGKGAANNNMTFKVIKLTSPLTVGNKTFPAGMLIEVADGNIPINVEGMATGSTYAEFFRPFNRIEDGTALPTDAYSVKFNFDWNLTDKFSVSPNVIYSYEDSDDTSWEREIWNAGINLSLMVNEKFNAFLSYNYINQTTTTDVYYSFFNG